MLMVQERPSCKIHADYKWLLWLLGHPSGQAACRVAVVAKRTLSLCDLTQFGQMLTLSYAG